MLAGTAPKDFISLGETSANLLGGPALHLLSMLVFCLLASGVCWTLLEAAQMRAYGVPAWFQRALGATAFILTDFGPEEGHDELLGYPNWGFLMDWFASLRWRLDRMLFVCALAIVP